MQNGPVVLVSLACALSVTPAQAEGSAGAKPDPNTSAPQTSPDAEVEPRPHHPWHLELALFPVLTIQQIEGPDRDDLVTRDGGISTAFGVSYAPIEYLEPGLWMQFDAGTVRRAVFGADPANPDAGAQQVEGSYWAFWLAFMLRGRFGPAFAEVGWSPLILRNDSLRSDLPNVDGDAGGVFEGSRSVAWLLGGGASIPVADHLDITLRAQFRIRYLVSRGGEPLAADVETGQITLWPYVGTHFHF